MATNKPSKIPQDESRAKVAELYRRLRENASKIAYSTFGTQDPDLEQVEKELSGEPGE
jgi:hypothetical protein